MRWQSDRRFVAKTGEQKMIGKIAQYVRQIDAAAGLKIAQHLVQHIG